MRSDNRRRGLRNLASDSGQGMTEYIIVVALIAIAAIGTVTVLGKDLRQLYAAAVEALAGDTNVTAKTRPGEGQAKADKVATLRTFGQNN